MNFPPEFDIQAYGETFIMSCLECGVSVAFANITLDNLNEEAEVHKRHHLMEMLYDQQHQSDTQAPWGSTSDSKEKGD